MKLGDKIAVFATGKLEQYDDPETILTRPANDFVSDFVGGGAAVRRLSLLDLSRLELHPIETDEKAVGSQNGTPVAEVDGSGKPVSWRHLPGAEASGTPLVTVPLSGTVYDAVDVMLDGSRLAGGRGRRGGPRRGRPALERPRRRPADPEG